jgi:hypothetical protein
MTTPTLALKRGLTPLERTLLDTLKDIYHEAKFGDCNGRDIWIDAWSARYEAAKVLQQRRKARKS